MHAHPCAHKCTHTERHITYQQKKHTLTRVLTQTHALIKTLAHSFERMNVIIHRDTRNINTNKKRHIHTEIQTHIYKQVNLLNKRNTIHIRKHAHKQTNCNGCSPIRDKENFTQPSSFERTQICPDIKFLQINFELYYPLYGRLQLHYLKLN